MAGERASAEHSLRGFHSVSAALEGYESSAKLLTEVFGYELVQEKGQPLPLCSARHDRTS